MQNYMRSGGIGMQTDGGGFGSRPGGGQITPNSGGGMGGNVPSAIMGAMGGAGSIPYQGWNQNNNFGMGDQPPQYTEAMARMQQQCMAGDGYACNQLKIMQSRMGEQNSQWQQQYGQRQQRYNSVRPGTPGQNRWG